MKLRSRKFESLESRQLLAADFAFEFASGETAAAAQSPLEIVFNYGPGMRENPQFQTIRASLQRAADQWRAHIFDPVTLFVNVDFDTLPGEALGAASSRSEPLSYRGLRAAMVRDGAAEPDDSILNFLPDANDLRFNLDEGIDFSTGAVNQGEFTVNTGLLKAIGELLPDNPAYVLPDANLVFSDAVFDPDEGGPLPEQSIFEFDNRVEPVAPFEFDFETVAVHELGHLFGFISSVEAIAANGVGVPSPMDLFRFAKDLRTANPATPEEFATFPRELRQEVIPIADFVTPEDWGPIVEFQLEQGTDVSGQQASHWADEDLVGGRPIGVLDPTILPGTVIPPSAADLRMLDLLGWDITSDGEYFLQIDFFDPREVPEDVNQDGSISAVDALVVVNSLNSGTSVEGESEASDRSRRTDVNRDGKTTAIDALSILNYLNKRQLAKPTTAVDVAIAEFDASEDEEEADDYRFHPDYEL